MIPKGGYAPPPGQAGGWQQAGGVPEPLGKLPVHRVCPTCNKEGLTTVKSSIQLKGWLLILFLGLCGLIACCQDGWHEFKHKCSYCGFSFGSFEPQLTTHEKLSLAAAICCVIIIPVIIMVIYFVLILSAVAVATSNLDDYNYQG